MNNSGTFTKLRPQSLLKQLFNCSESICLQVFSNSVFWWVYLEEGKIIYATHSVEPFDRLERHLRRLSHQIPSLTSEVRVQLRLMFESDTHSQVVEHESNSINQPPEYQAIQWLISQQYLHSTQAAVLIPELVKEVLESFLLIKEGTYELTEPLNRMPIICRLNVENILERCQARLKSWKSFEPQISSPYQRPYLLITGKPSKQNLPDLQPNLTNWMKGFSLRHLAVIMNQDEIELAQNLYPYIIQGGIILHEPDPPFDQLPNTLEDLTQSSKLITLVNQKLVDVAEELSTTNSKSYPNIFEDNKTTEQLPQFSESLKENLQKLTITNNINPVIERVAAATVTSKKTYKIVSVDDSPTILKEISRFLENENFSVVTINEPLKAVMSIIRHKPDLILLDLNMVGIDGYELCQIIRNNSLFKEIPIIFVTGNKGIVDKVKARLVGASGYLTKPFTRAELLKIVFMHLT
ncbi:response regulator [Komarekiella sp. 'clone 1']|uniref:Response regulator n=1 Tax=Komarekiella delphini-convector SJRDD-AB1 TaxID=2593771 RepID=A0AA40VTM6_9NOST|nr:response regulator [Komarekiella delphini-convector]MBD6619262.1 response regulator [Komarekiella delphini-convector SJRDD-AB1]